MLFMKYRGRGVAASGVHYRAMSGHAAALARAETQVAAVRDDQWSRTGRRSDGAVFTVESFGRYLVHDPVHHVWDVEQGYAALRG